MPPLPTSLATSVPEQALDASDLNEIVARHNNAEDQCRALTMHILRRFEAANNIDDAVGKKNAFWSIANAILQQSRRIISPQSRLALAASGGKEDVSRANHELRMFKLAMGTVNHVLRDLAPREFIDPRRQYSAELDGDYPLRWTDGAPAIVEFDANPGLDPALLEGIKPYIDPLRSNADRSLLYLANLYSRRMSQDDLLCPQEKALIGQWGVFAKRFIPEGVCIGIYGGTLLEPKDLITIADRRYLAKATATAQEYLVNGENVLSLMNTIFLFEPSGRIVAQDARQHNVRAQPFRCKTSSGIIVSLTAFFSSRGIEQDSELRWNYGYDEEALIRNGLR